MKTTQEHCESWKLVLRREESDEGWPESLLRPYSKGNFRPEIIVVYIKRDSAYASGVIEGTNLKKDGTLGRTDTRWSTYGSRFKAGMEWAQKLVDAERRRLDLGPDTTGCGW